MDFRVYFLIDSALSPHSFIKTLLPYEMRIYRFTASSSVPEENHVHHGFAWGTGPLHIQRHASPTAGSIKRTTERRPEWLASSDNGKPHAGSQLRASRPAAEIQRKRETPNAAPDSGPIRKHGHGHPGAIRARVHRFAHPPWRHTPPAAASRRKAGGGG